MSNITRKAFVLSSQTEIYFIQLVAFNSGAISRRIRVEGSFIAKIFPGWRTSLCPGAPDEARQANQSRGKRRQGDDWPMSLAISVVKEATALLD
ncbi:hypothetical protein CEXT_410031 [Caerostris extrusa]|uniref:Uncharacterized protein n=1 Tax=Caerostris extrusa TaxID=172846 RepID=A0AAV4XL60_CAEEX|nr:hypothetical protein CEXT_410031 [Caerostris extrusa]